ncbi:protease modulator HflC [Vibrio sp. WXL210]|uniref:protease modulator HflC n=1 Tax=Vibrio sp. WXL210 TaxID=3450709 RepID=UPI003EC85D61
MKIYKWMAGVTLLCLYLLSTSLMFVKETDFVIVSRFGKPVRLIEEAGLAFKLPLPIENTIHVDKRVRMLDLATSEYGTKDRRNVVVDAFLVWKVIDPQRFVSSVRNMETAELRIEAMTNSQIGAAIASAELNRIFSLNAEDNKIQALFEGVTELVDAQAQREFGVAIASISPNRFSFPSQNLQAIYKRMESEWDRLAKQYRAEGEEAASQIRSETEVEVARIKAEAYKQSQKLKGEADAKASSIYASAFESNPEYYKFVRSMEAYQQIFNQQTQLILSTDSPLFEPLLTPPEAE